MATPAPRSAPFRRRRRGPVVAIVSVLAVLAIATWTVVLVNATGPGGPASCPAPVQGPPPGEVLASDALDGVAPAPPQVVRVRVLNAGGQRGQANLVAAQLGDLGFGSAAPPDNDPFYAEGDMDCVGQLRFGPVGEAAASTLTLVLPCSELVRDARADDSVDVAVGTAFADVNPGRPVRDVLDTLTGDDEPVDPAATPSPVVDPAALAAARDATC